MIEHAFHEAKNKLGMGQYQVWVWQGRNQIDVVYFPDGAGGDRFEEKIFRGPLDRMLRESLAFIQSRFLGEGVIKHPDRAEAERFYNFPYEALEESLANAVYHRGYDESEPIEVRISPEVIIIVNYPGPDRSVRLDQLREGKAIPRRYRNRRIGASMRSRRNPQTSAIPLFPGRVSLFQGFPNDSESSQGNFTTRAPRLPWRRRG